MLLVDLLSENQPTSALMDSALNALKSGQVDIALEKSKQLLAIDAHNPSFLILAADCFNYYGKYLDALGLVQIAVSSQQDLAFFLIESEQLSRLNRFEQSLECLIRAKRLYPEDSHLLQALFQQLCFLENYSEARSLLESNRQQLVSHLQFFPLAIDLYRQLDEHHLALDEARAWCLHVGNRSKEAMKALADCWFSLGNFDNYASLIRDASCHFVDDQNLQSLRLQAALDQSIKNLPEAMDEINALKCHNFIDPGLALLCSRVFLAQSDFKFAWSLYERRLKLSPSPLYAPVDINHDPLCDCTDRTVVLVAEQGVGDVLFFARFIPSLVADAHRVICLVDDRLSPLFQRCFPDLIVLTNLKLAHKLAGIAPIFLAIGSLAMRYASTTDQVISSQHNSTIFPHPTLSWLWRESLPPRAVNVGLSLTAGLQQGSYKTSKRSVPFTVVHEALVTADVSIHDLRHYYDDPLVISNVHSYPDITNNLELLLSLISCMDILVTSDQTNAFLGGILGIPTLVIVPPNPHFVFMVEGEKTPWFDNITLIRSSCWDGWDALTPIFEEKFNFLLSSIVRG